MSHFSFSANQAPALVRFQPDFRNPARSDCGCIVGIHYVPSVDEVKKLTMNVCLLFKVWVRRRHIQTTRLVVVAVPVTLVVVVLPESPVIMVDPVGPVIVADPV